MIFVLAPGDSAAYCPTEKMSRNKNYGTEVIGTFFASLRFGVAAPRYPKTPLHKKCPKQRCYGALRSKLILSQCKTGITSPVSLAVLIISHSFFYYRLAIVAPPESQLQTEVACLRRVLLDSADVLGIIDIY